jgi:hypothetical protein
MSWAEVIFGVQLTSAQDTSLCCLYFNKIVHVDLQVKRVSIDPVRALRKSKKVKLSCHHHAGDKAEKIQSSYIFLTSAPDGGEWSASRPSHALPPRKDPRYPLDRRLGGP